MSINVILDKIITIWEDPDLQYPYTSTLIGVKESDGTPVSTEQTNSGGTADADWIDDVVSGASWVLVN